MTESTLLAMTESDVVSRGLCRVEHHTQRQSRRSIFSETLHFVHGISLAYKCRLQDIVASDLKVKSAAIASSVILQQENAVLYKDYHPIELVRIHTPFQHTS